MIGEMKTFYSRKLKNKSPGIRQVTEQAMMHACQEYTCHTRALIHAREHYGFNM